MGILHSGKRTCVCVCVRVCVCMCVLFSCKSNGSDNDVIDSSGMSPLRVTGTTSGCWTQMGTTQW